MKTLEDMSVTFRVGVRGCGRDVCDTSRWEVLAGGSWARRMAFFLCGCRKTQPAISNERMLTGLSAVRREYEALWRPCGLEHCSAGNQGINVLVHPLDFMTKSVSRILSTDVPNPMRFEGSTRYDVRGGLRVRCHVLEFHGGDVHMIFRPCKPLRRAEAQLRECLQGRGFGRGEAKGDEE